MGAAAARAVSRRASLRNSTELTSGRSSNRFPFTATHPEVRPADLAGARAAYERALRIDEAVFGPEHPNVAIRVNNLGGVRAFGLWRGAITSQKASCGRYVLPSLGETSKGR
jgi:hypothetical protein